MASVSLLTSHEPSSDNERISAADWWQITPVKPQQPRQKEDGDQVVNSSLSMFIESCEVVAVKCNCGKYVTRSHPVFAETCTEHEHTTDTQNGKRKKERKTSPEFVFFFFFYVKFKILFIQKYITVEEKKEEKKNAVIRK